MIKPRILFVDDEPRILDGLRRSLRSRRGDWDMHFAGGGVEALTLLGQASHDIVVSDMRMPGMGGAELLTQVSLRYPEVARVVLSGHIEPEAAITVAFAGQRFLTKPSDLEALTGVIEQLLVRTSPDHQVAARRIAGGVRSISTLREHSDRLAALLRPGADLSYAVQTALHDVGLTAKLLQLSNSTFFGDRPRNASVESVVYAMGMPTIQAVAGAGKGLGSSEPGDPEMERHLAAAWRHAMATGRLVGLVASPANRPHAQAAALLQDVGLLICLAAAGEAAAGEGPAPSIDLVAARCDGVPFRDVGVELLHLWGLPSPIVTAVAQRDTPQQPSAAGLGVAAAVRTAHLLIQQVEAGASGDDPYGEELALLLAHPQLRAHSVDWRETAAQAYAQAVEWAPAEH